MAAETGKLVGLQNLRALAAYMVAAFHIFEAFHSSNGWIKLIVGQAGVDIFFVISGLIMVLVVADDEKPGAFFLKRVFRIFPLYWAITLVHIALAIAAPNSDPNIDLSPGSLINSLLLIPTMRADGGDLPIAIAGWTLVLEMAFYALFALSLNFKPSRRIPLLCGFIVLGLLAARWLGQGTIFAFYGKNIVLEFAAGCVLGAALRSGKLKALAAPDRRIVFFWLPIALSMIGFVCVNPFEVEMDWRPIFYGVPAFLLVAAVALNEIHGRPAKRSFVTALGDASYSAYLIYDAVFIVATHLCYHLLGEGFLRDALLLLMLIGGTVIGSLLCYRWIERPSNSFLRGLVFDKRRRAALAQSDA